jgi:hypothetical protein
MLMIIQTFIHEFFVSNLGQYTDCHDLKYSWDSSVSLSKLLFTNLLTI